MWSSKFRFIRKLKLNITFKSTHKRLLFFCCPKGGFTEGAIAYFKEHLTDSRIYPQEWKTELKSLTEQKQKLYSEYESLKTENKLLDDIKRTVNSALRKQGRQTPKRNIDYER